MEKKYELEEFIDLLLSQKTSNAFFTKDGDKNLTACFPDKIIHNYSGERVESLWGGNNLEYDINIYIDICSDIFEIFSKKERKYLAKDIESCKEYLRTNLIKLNSIFMVEGAGNDPGQILLKKMLFND